MSGHDETLREELSALLDGAVPAEREAELRALLELDEGLRAEYEALRETVQLVRGLPRERAPAELRERLRASRPRGLAPLLRLAVPLAAAAVVLVAFVLNLQQTQPVDSTEVAKGTSGKSEPVAEPPAPAPVGDRDRVAETEELRRTVDRARETKKETGDDKVRLLEEVEPAFEARAKLGSYLVQLESLDAPALRNHIASFAQSAGTGTPPAVRTPADFAEAATADAADEGGAGGAGGARAPAEEDSEIQVAPFTTVVVSGREDARRVERLLLRAYEAPKQATDTLGKSRAAGEPDAGAKAGRIRRSQARPPATGAPIRVELEVTPAELAQIEAWLARVSVSGPSAGLAGTAATVISGAVARQRLRVVIHVLAPAPSAPVAAPAPPAAAEGEKDR